MCVYMCVCISENQQSGKEFVPHFRAKMKSSPQKRVTRFIANESRREGESAREGGRPCRAEEWDTAASTWPCEQDGTLGH